MRHATKCLLSLAVVFALTGEVKAEQVPVGTISANSSEAQSQEFRNPVVTYLMEYYNLPEAEAQF